eukprot:Gb_05196 [translate_table: standard]
MLQHVEGKSHGSQSSQSRLISNVIFDLDGTLLNTEGIMEDVLKDFLAKYEKQWDGRGQAQRLGKMPLEAAEIIIKDYQLPCTAEEFLAEILPWFEDRQGFNTAVWLVTNLSVSQDSGLLPLIVILRKNLDNLLQKLTITGLLLNIRVCAKWAIEHLFLPDFLLHQGNLPIDWNTPSGACTIGETASGLWVLKLSARHLLSLVEDLKMTSTKVFQALGVLGVSEQSLRAMACKWPKQTELARVKKQLALKRKEKLPDNNKSEVVTSNITYHHKRVRGENKNFPVRPTFLDEGTDVVIYRYGDQRLKMQQAQVGEFDTDLSSDETCRATVDRLKQ